MDEKEFEEKYIKNYKPGNATAYEEKSNNSNRGDGKHSSGNENKARSNRRSSNGNEDVLATGPVEIVHPIRVIDRDCENGGAKESGIELPEVTS